MLLPRCRRSRRLGVVHCELDRHQPAHLQVLRLKTRTLLKLISHIVAVRATIKATSLPHWLGRSGVRRHKQLDRMMIWAFAFLQMRNVPLQISPRAHLLQIACILVCLHRISIASPACSTATRGLQAPVPVLISHPTLAFACRLRPFLIFRWLAPPSD